MISPTIIVRTDASRPSVARTDLRDSEVTATCNPPRYGLLHIAIESFASHPFRLVRPLPVAIEVTDDGVVAHFWDANIHTSGETVIDAIDSLKSLIIDVHELLLEHRATLGPEPLKQLTVLEEFLRPA